MEVFVKGLSYRATELEIHQHFEEILHGPRYTAMWDRGYPMNFDLYVFPSKKQTRQQNRGIALIRIPSAAIAQTLIEDSKQASDHITSLLGRRFTINVSNKQVYDYTQLEKTPYVNPGELQERAQLEAALSKSVPIKALHFGWLDRDWAFSKECSREYGAQANGSSGTGFFCQMEFDDSKREFTVTEESSEGLDSFLRRRLTPGLLSPRRMTTRFSNVASLHTSDNDDPICSLLITLHSAPVFEDSPLRDEISSILSALRKPPLRQRHVSFNDSRHRRCVAYTSVTILLEFEKRSERRVVLDMAKAARLPHASKQPARPTSRGHFSDEVLYDFEEWIGSLPWALAFQCKALVQSLLVSPKEMMDLELRRRIDSLARKYRHDLPTAANIIVDFGVETQYLEFLEAGSGTESIGKALLECFDQALGIKRAPFLARAENEDIFLCYHVDRTPTSLKLKGPDPIQSNRVLRQYRGHQDRFLRVAFTDEDRLQFRWDSDVDGASFVRRTVGQQLKTPLKLAGRAFEFLAYSNSALKEHSVWFVAPFLGSDGEVVNANTIRAGLGDFTKVIRCPARLGARMSQAFTSTDVTVTATSEEVIVVADITNRDGVNFTDGVGTCPRKTMDLITQRMRAKSKKAKIRSFLPPGAVQIRHGGSKGMLSVDYKLGDDDPICLRTSMMKFASHSYDLEVANTFEGPKPMYLNRPLIMVLETLEVPIDVFVKLQTKELHAASEALSGFRSSRRLFEQHGLGSAFRLPSIFHYLAESGLESPPEDDLFLMRGLVYGANDVLRSLKYRARVPVPNSWTLVGVADVHGYLDEGEIFASYTDSDGKIHYIEGRVLITRAPVIHPGDVQYVDAIGPPPPGSPFDFEPLPNCVVFATKGRLSTPQSLGGGDLDGDLYNLIQYSPLFPRYTVVPAEYPPTKLKELPMGRQATIDDVADHVVDFINNDHLGMIANENLIIADQSPEMSADPKCLVLAELHSVAVDFQKSGIPADLSAMPRRNNDAVPDWSVGELIRNYRKEFYPSKRALGVLFRNVEVSEFPVPERPSQNDELDGIGESLDAMAISASEEASPLSDPITDILKPQLQPHISLSLLQSTIETLIPQFDRYRADLLSICRNSSLSFRSPLTEEECFAGTIIAKTSQPRRRTEAQAQMRDQCTRLVDALRHELGRDDDEKLADWLGRTWTAWNISAQLGDMFGAKSYGYIALGSMIEALKAIELRDREAIQRGY